MGESSTASAITSRRQGGVFENPWSAAGQPRRLGAFLKWILLERPFNRTGRRVDRRTFAHRFSRGTPAYAAPRAALDDLTVTWVGHSSFLIQIGGWNVLTDPIWSARASPAQWIGPRRWMPPGVEFAALPPIDVILISHDHYDHLDAPTVAQLVALPDPPRWYAPLGVRRWLEERGARQVTELDWWAAVRLEGTPTRAPLELTATPAQHFSGRAFNNRNHTLWCGWSVRARSHSVWFVGDTGRHPEFAEIGRRLGPFDAVLMPIGAYDPQWFMGAVHVAPEDAVAAFTEAAAPSALDAASPRQWPVMVGMHWGTFRLTDEPMDEPPDRARAAWAAAGLPADRLWIPRHGETRIF